MGTGFHAVVAGALDQACATASTLFGWLGIAVLCLGGARAIGALAHARLLDIISLTREAARVDDIALAREAARVDRSHFQARLNLGKHLALGLEFLVARDVLDTIVEPTWDELGKLAAIIVLRTAIQRSLSRELREIAGERA